MNKPFVQCKSLDVFNTLKISSSQDNTIYTINNGTQTFGIPDIKWGQIVFIEKEKLIWSHGILYSENDVDLSKYVTADEFNQELSKIDLSKFLLKTEFEDSIDTTNLVTKGSMATINGNSLINGGNIEIDSSIYKIVTELPNENILLDKIYLMKASTSTSTTTNFECWKYENDNWVDLGPFGSVKIDMSLYLSKSEADQRYMVKSSNANSSLIVLDNGQVNNLGNNGQAFNAIRNLTNFTPKTYHLATGSSYPLNCASFGLKSNGTAAFSHKKYDTYVYDKTTNTDKTTGAKNTAVLVFSGNSGLMYAKNTGSASDVTDAMYKYVGVIDSPDEKQRCYSAKQVDGIVDALSQRIDDLESQNEYLMNVINVLINKVGITPEELSADGTAQQSLSLLSDDVNTNISNNTIDYSGRSNETDENSLDV